MTSKQKKYAFSPRALGFFVMGALLLMVPYLVGHNGYGGEVLIADADAKPPFDQSLILVGRHNIDGAMGFIINKPLSEEQRSKLPGYIRDSGIPVSYGGPLDVSDKIFVLEQKTAVYPGEGIDFDISDWDDAIKETPNLMDKMRQNLKSGEPRYRVFTGYVGWGPFQLEAEILLKKSWSGMRSSHDLIFQKGNDTNWDALEKAQKQKRLNLS